LRAAAWRNEIRRYSGCFKAPADHERVCILNERECCRGVGVGGGGGVAMPGGENSATR